MSQLRLGIVGACGRGRSFRAACEALASVKIQAVWTSTRPVSPRPPNFWVRKSSIPAMTKC
jgi:hypothetical protein